MSDIQESASADVAEVVGWEVADRFTVEQLWMLYGLAAGEATTRERAEREAFSDLDSAAWIGVRAKLRYLIEVERP